MSVRKPGTIDCFRASEGWYASRFPARIVRLPSSRSKELTSKARSASSILPLPSATTQSLAWSGEWKLVRISRSSRPWPIPLKSIRP